MSWWRVTVTSEQAIVIGTGATRAFHTPSLGYIPGSTLRGALAAAWRIRYGDPDPAFRKTFDHSVRFGPLLAVMGDVASQSVLRRKYTPGDGEYVDCAFEDAGDAVGEHLKGDVIWGDENALKVVTTTAIDPEKRTALDGNLFSREAHRRRQTYHGLIHGDENLVGRLAELESASIGGRRSVMGRARIRIEPAQPPELPESGDVVLRTLSPTILLDDAGGPSLDWEGAKAFEGFDVVGAWGGRLAGEGISGWHMASGTPKPGDIAVAPGAVVKLREPGRDKVLELLERGLGTRRAEGFGWLERVTKPWRPPGGKPGEERAGGVATPDLDAMLGWPLEDRRAVADWLQELREGDGTEPLESRRAWLNLTEGRRAAARRVIRDTPQAQRNPWASRLREGRN